MTAVELTDHIGAELHEPDDRAAFVIDNDRKAAWAMRKLRAALAEAERIRLEAANELDAITRWRDDALRGPQHDVEFFRALLVGYRHELELANPDLPKTYPVPGGKLIRRKGRTRVEITDEAAFVAWALDNDRDALKVTPLKSRLTAKGSGYIEVPPDTDGPSRLAAPTGEVVPAVELVAGDDTYDAVPTDGAEVGGDES